MKRSIFFFLLCGLSYTVKGQYTLIPDVQFEEELIYKGLDSGDPDGKVLTANIQDVKDLWLFNSGIKDLTGIEDFLALESLNCESNELTSLDLQYNTALKTLDCSSNALTFLGLMHNVQLIEIRCISNESLKEIDLSQNLALVEADLNYNDALEKLIVSNNPQLTVLKCNSGALEELVIPNSPRLRELHCMGNEIRTLDLAANPLLEYVDCSWNDMEELDVTACSVLNRLDCQYNKLTELDVSKNLLLEGLNCFFNDLTVLDAANVLGWLKCENNKIESLDFTGSMIRSITCNNNLITSLDLTGAEHLEFLDCGLNPMEELDLSTNTALTSMNCPFNNFKHLDISHTSLGFLECSGGELETMEIGIETLHTLQASSNKLTALDLSNCANLRNLHVDGNDLTELSISALPRLYQLQCAYNELRCLNLKNGNNQGLSIFSARFNDNLACIEVDDVEDANQYFASRVDEGVQFSTNCNNTCTVLSIEEQVLQDVTVFPNPTLGEVTVDLSSLNGEVEFEVSDLTGKAVKHEKNMLWDRAVLDIQAGPGLYFVRVQAVEFAQSRTFKVIKR